MTTTQKILNIIREKNPETMGLSFGCEVEATKKYEDNRQKDYKYFVGCESCYADTHRMAGYVRIFEMRNEAVDVDFLKKGGVYTTDSYVHEDNITIIGHPLYPAHLLVALGDKSLFYLSSGGILHKKTEVGFDYVCSLNLTQPIEPQLEADPKLAETIYKLLSE